MSEVDLTKAAAPKSDQLNADDLIGGSRTIKITKVSGNADDKQPISVYFEGDNGKPYKPCKSMTRILIRVWGNVAANFIGRTLTLYRDDKVLFGGIEVGGIRISHMSDITEAITMSLTASRASRKPYTVRPLGNAAESSPSPINLETLTKEKDDLKKKIEMAESGAELDAIEKICDEFSVKLQAANLGQWNDKLLGILESKRGEFSSANPMLG